MVYISIGRSCSVKYQIDKYKHKLETLFFDWLMTSINSKGPDIRRGVGELDNLQLGVSLAQAQIGTNLNVVDQQTAVLEDTTLNLKTTLSSIEDLDYASAITKMNQQMLSLEAAQSSFAKMSQLNLFNFIN